uniref:Uncharacterized protein n=1 Tax=Arion vulgaris TaxID=1028688 RepID=A0A0B7A2Q5_9EUPU
MHNSGSDNKDINNSNSTSDQQVISCLEGKERSSLSTKEVHAVLQSSRQQNNYSCIHLPIHHVTTSMIKQSVSSPKKTQTLCSNKVPYISDIGFLMRRMKNVRFSFAPETCI